MKILIIEDDEFKGKRIAQAVQDWRSDTGVLDMGLLMERSVNSGLSAIVKDSPDMILLDMSLTTFDVGPGEHGGRPQNFGGIEVLRQMDRLHIVVPVIVITQHERFAKGTTEVHLTTVYKELKEQHGHAFRGLVYYDSAAGRWERELRKLMVQVARQVGGHDVRKSTRRRRRSA